MAAGNRHTVYTAGGKGRITVGGEVHELKEGASFFLRPTYDFKIEAEAGAPLTFYIRSDATVPDAGARDPFSVVNRFDGDKRLGIHWSHINSGGLPGMVVITLAPGTMPHPHSHDNEEVWMQIKGETLLSIGKTLRTMTPGQAIRIPPTGLTAHSSINLGDEPVQMIVMIASGAASRRDYAQLEPGTSAHRVDGQLAGAQQTFVVDSGTGTIASGGRTAELAKGMAFVLTPGLDFKLTATGDRYLNFYVVTEALDAAAPPGPLRVIDRRAGPQSLNAWTLTERDVVRREDGLLHYKAITAAKQPPRTMSRPYSVAPGGEEIWIATEGKVELLLGKQLFKLPAGTAFAVPPGGLTAQAKLNPGQNGAAYLYLAK